MPKPEQNNDFNLNRFKNNLATYEFITNDHHLYSVDGVQPQLVIRPNSLESIAITLQEAHAQNAAVIIHGGRTATAIGNIPQRYNLALDTTGINHTEAFEPADFTITVQAGLRFAELSRILEARKQLIPLDIPHAERATIGGIIARGRGGSRRVNFGTVRDWLIGCSVVLANGSSVRGGGRVVKNVSGYDLPKLFTGSFGTLACIVSATFKVRPIHPMEESLILSTPNFEIALNAGQILAKRFPALHSIVAIDGKTASRLDIEYPALIIRGGGLKESIQPLLQNAQAAAYETFAENQYSAVEVRKPGSNPELWQKIADLELPEDSNSHMLWRCGIPRTSISQAYKIILELDSKARIWSYADAGLIFAEIDGSDPLQAAKITQTARIAIQSLQGSLIVDKAPVQVKSAIDIWGEAGGLEIMRQIKQHFDPNSILNPGRFLEGI